MLALLFSGFSLPAKCIKAVHGKLSCYSLFYNNINIFFSIHFRRSCLENRVRETDQRKKNRAICPSRENRRRFPMPPQVSPRNDAWSRNERKNSILMTLHFQDHHGCASDWLKISFDQSEALPRSGKWRVNSVEFLCLFLRRHFAGLWRRIISAVFSDYIIPCIHHSSRTISAQEIAQLLYNICVFM